MLFFFLKLFQFHIKTVIIKKSRVPLHQEFHPFPRIIEIPLLIINTFLTGVKVQPKFSPLKLNLNMNKLKMKCNEETPTLKNA